MINSLDEVIDRLQYKADNIKAKLEPSYFTECIEYLKTLPKENKWIPCSERMPKVTDYYLIQHTRQICHDEMAVAFYSVEEARCDKDYDWEFETMSDVQEVIAWQPLPEEYRKAEQMKGE